MHVLLHTDVLLKLPMSVSPLSASPAENPKSLLCSKTHPATMLPWQHAMPHSQWQRYQRGSNLCLHVVLREVEQAGAQQHTLVTRWSPRSDVFLRMPLPQQGGHELQPQLPSLPAAFQGLNPLVPSPRGPRGTGVIAPLSAYSYHLFPSHLHSFGP